MKENSRKSRRRQLRDLVASEAAKLLYNGEFREYIDAKRAAAEALKTSILPSNHEVALKVLEYALEVEGEDYWRRLKELREEALEVMQNLSEFNPRLVGSVWRGVIKPSSDIDIEVDSEALEEVKQKIEESGYEILGIERINVPEPLRYGSLWRVKIRSRKGHEVEIILKEHSSYLNPPKCDIFGDVKKGLNISELRKILREMPTALFIPEGRRRWR
ncbi:MAG: hypothetical protein DRN68_09355 [Thaumarchaeota archaeon]|nr:MAG: hypothetical protein DRN68_09355 [Nitrososphaerota archaeon]